MSQIPITPGEELELQQAAARIRSRQDFVAFTRTLAEDARRNPGEWENRDLPSFLAALAAWIEDMDGYYANQGEPIPEPPTWKAMGEFLLAARVYE